MKTKKGSATEYIVKCWENGMEVSVDDVEDFMYQTQKDSHNRFNSYSTLTYTKRRYEKIEKQMIVVRNGVYKLADETNKAEILLEGNKRKVGTIGWSKSLQSWGESIINSMPKLSNEMKIALLEAVNKVKDLEIVIYKERTK